VEKSQDKPIRKEVRTPSNSRGGTLKNLPSKSSSKDSPALRKSEQAKHNLTGKDRGLIEEGGNARPSKTRNSLRNTRTKKTNDKHSSSSRDSTPDQSRLLRSDSFTKDGPSGVVPDNEIPDVSLVRSSSFTKLHPGLPEELIPRITSESSDFTLDVDTSLDTSLLMKDTDEVRGNVEMKKNKPNA